MSDIIELSFREEIERASSSRLSGHSKQEWTHLERAHILGRFRVLKHFYVHLKMIGYSVHFRLPKEFFGQIPRIILAIPGSLFRLAPKGNTGGANVGIFQPMEIPDDLKIILEKSK